MGELTPRGAVRLSRYPNVQKPSGRLGWREDRGAEADVELDVAPFAHLGIDAQANVAPVVYGAQKPAIDVQEDDPLALVTIPELAGHSGLSFPAPAAVSIDFREVVLVVKTADVIEEGVRPFVIVRRKRGADGE